MRRGELLLLVLFFTPCCSSPDLLPDANPPPGIPGLEEMRAEHGTESCRLKYWEDGDTPVVTCKQASEPQTVRMIGIDTAESGFDDNSRKRARKQARLWGMSYEEVLACGKAATRRVCELCPPDSPVEIVGTELGKYGRRLAYVVCRGINMNRRLVAEGLAGNYPYPDPAEKPAACPVD